MRAKKKGDATLFLTSKPLPLNFNRQIAQGMLATLVLCNVANNCSNQRRHLMHLQLY
jgi:hypothetical protein